MSLDEADAVTRSMCAAALQVHECFLKQDYTSSDVPAGQTLSACHHYTVWEAGPIWDQHGQDPSWSGASGPVTCRNVVADSVQSVAVTRVPGYTGAIVAAATPSIYPFANGYLSFYNAVTLAYLGCAEAGNKPEGIASNTVGNIACINEGSAREDNNLDHFGSMTMCTAASTSTWQLVAFSCVTHIPGPDTFTPGAWLSASEYRQKDVRLFGPSGNEIAHDLEPEGGDFTADGRYFMVNIQDNNAYIMFDISLGKYIFMSGYGYKAQTMDASDRDNFVNIKSSWGAQSVPNYAIHMPDQVSSFMVGSEYYFITSNEGGSRDGESGLIGQSGDFEGEEIRMGQLGTCTCTDCCGNSEMGRLLTTTFQPSDYAINACGMNICNASALAKGIASDFQCIYDRADYGGASDQAACGYATTVQILVDSLDKTTTDIISPQPNGVSLGKTASSTFSFPGWFSGTTTVSASINGPPSCQAACLANALCDHWTYEFEQGYHECFLKQSHFNDPSNGGAVCHLYVPYVQHYEDPDWEGSSGPKQCFPSASPASKAPYTSTQAPGTNGHGSAGGSYSIGGRSFTIWHWDGVATELTAVFDSGSKMEDETFKVNNNLCSGCDNAANSLRCSVECPFNSDDFGPPSMDDRSDANCPEPECVTTGVMSDGTRLSFVGLERTGGIMTYDITDPASATFQDFLNVRNWQVGETAARLAEGNAGKIKYALNDGPRVARVHPGLRVAYRHRAAACGDTACRAPYRVRDLEGCAPRQRRVVQGHADVPLCRDAVRW